jgi:hypothetical protein
MRLLVLTLLLAVISPAQAQHLPSPKTVTIKNNATDEVIGTMTISGNTAYLRDKDGEHQATVVTESDRSQTVYDPSGKILRKLPAPAPK